MQNNTINSHGIVVSSLWWARNDATGVFTRKLQNYNTKLFTEIYKAIAVLVIIMPLYNPPEVGS